MSDADKVGELAKLVTKYVMEYNDTHRLAVPYRYVSQMYSKRAKSLGVDLLELIRQQPKVITVLSKSGGMLITHLESKIVTEAT